MKNLIYDKKMYNKIKSIINAADPVDLISGGAPDDEYEAEVVKTLELFQANECKEISGADIHKIFIQMFGADIAGEKGVYDDIAEKIIAALCKR